MEKENNNKIRRATATSHSPVLIVDHTYREKREEKRRDETTDKNHGMK